MSDRVAPSLDGRFVEAKIALEALQDALYEASSEARAGCSTTIFDLPVWRCLEQAADTVTDAMKDLMTAKNWIRGARLREGGTPG